MMAAVFAAMSLALVLSWFGRRSVAIVCLLACLILAVKLFLFEVYSAEYGFRMPWLQVELFQNHTPILGGVHV